MNYRKPADAVMNQNLMNNDKIQHISKVPTVEVRMPGMLNLGANPVGHASAPG
jgi:hypothetical protein